MAALHFIYSTMNAGKSTALLQASHGYRERGLETMVFTSSKDTVMVNQKWYQELD